MAKYFNIQVGLRGCYMPDSSYFLKCETRRELKNAIDDEACAINSDGSTLGLSKRAVESVAAA